MDKLKQTVPVGGCSSRTALGLAAGPTGFCAGRRRRQPASPNHTARARQPLVEGSGERVLQCTFDVQVALGELSLTVVVGSSIGPEGESSAGIRHAAERPTVLEDDNR